MYSTPRTSRPKSRGSRTEGRRCGLCESHVSYSNLNLKNICCMCSRETSPDRVRSLGPVVGHRRSICPRMRRCDGTGRARSPGAVLYSMSRVVSRHSRPLVSLPCLTSPLKLISKLSTARHRQALDSGIAIWPKSCLRTEQRISVPRCGRGRKIG